MSSVEIGQRPPSFRLPAGQGGEISTDDYRGRQHLVVWFTKGMACPFCRTQMSQLARGYARLREAGAEVLQITPTRPARARFYAQHFPVPFPYLCDSDFRVHREWGLEVRSHSLPWYAKTFYTAAQTPPPPPTEVGDPKMSLAELPSLLQDSDMGFFVIGRDGVLRYKRTAPYNVGKVTTPIPSVEEVLTTLAPGAGAGEASRRPA